MMLEKIHRIPFTLPVHFILFLMANQRNQHCHSLETACIQSLLKECARSNMNSRTYGIVKESQTGQQCTENYAHHSSDTELAFLFLQKNEAVRTIKCLSFCSSKAETVKFTLLSFKKYYKCNCVLSLFSVVHSINYEVSPTNSTPRTSLELAPFLCPRLSLHHSLF